MQLLKSLDHLATHAGILAVSAALDKPGPRAFTYAGAERWHPLLAACTAMLDHTAEGSIRVLLGQHTVVVQREHGQIAAVCFETGDAVAKSVHRMVRYAARPEGRKSDRAAEVERVMSRPDPAPVKPAPAAPVAPSPSDPSSIVW